MSILFCTFVLYCNRLIEAMYLIPSKPIEGKIIYIAKSFRTPKGSSTTRNVRRLGTLEEIRRREGVSDAWAWVKAQVVLENTREKERLQARHRDCYVNEA